MKLNVGSKVTVLRPRAPFVAAVVRVNARTVTVRQQGSGKLWRVPLSYPMRAGAAKVPAAVRQPATRAARRGRRVMDEYEAEARMEDAGERAYAQSQRKSGRRAGPKRGARAPSQYVRASALRAGDVVELNGSQEVLRRKFRSTKSYTTWVVYEHGAPPPHSKHLSDGDFYSFPHAQLVKRLGRIAKTRRARST